MNKPFDFRSHIRTIPDFPKQGVQFRDVTSLLAHAGAFGAAVDALSDRFAERDPDAVVAMDARGFILGGAIAYRLSLPFVPIRKKGKLPGSALAEAYQLEYGEAVVEIHDDAIVPGTRALLIDDLLATGGTAAAGVRLIERLGGETIAAGFLVDLPDLGGRRRLNELGIEVHTLAEFEGD